MGYSQTSLAVREMPPDEILEILALRRTGTHEEFPESAWTAVNLPSGSFLVVASHAADFSTVDDLLSKLSLAGELVTCMVEEHVMASEAVCWRNGQLVWRVLHDSSNTKTPLIVEGEPPPGFAAIRDQYLAEQVKGDVEGQKTDYIFEIPVQLAFAFSGYRYGQDTPGLAVDAFEVLESIAQPPAKKSFFRRLFGG
jgi:hypothetical protein